MSFRWLGRWKMELLWDNTQALASCPSSLVHSVVQWAWRGCPAASRPQEFLNSL